MSKIQVKSDMLPSSDNLVSTEDIPAQKKPYWGAWPTVGFGCGLQVVSVFIAGLVTIGFLVIGFTSDSAESIITYLQGLLENGLYWALVTIATAIVCTYLIWLIIKLRHTLSVTEYLGLRPISVKAMLISLAMAVGLIALSDGLSYFLGKPIVSEWQLNLYVSSGWPVLLWAAFIVFGPIFEEALFRGLLFEGFRQSRMGAIGAVILTAFLWAISHVQYDAYGMIGILIWGIVLGVVRFRTGSLWSVLAMHALLNLVATVETALYIMAN
jgi:membrane protease YdiL (CAAX protease family)